MLTILAGVGVAASGIWLMALAGLVVVDPDRAARFLERFASSARAHYTEQILRITAGAAFIIFAPQMRFTEPFLVFGWVLVVSAAVLLLLPWKLHQRFADWATPLAIRNFRTFGPGAFALGTLVLFCML